MKWEWPVSTPTEQKINPEGLSQVEQMVTDIDNIYAFLVIRNGFIVSENYYNNRSEVTSNHIRSVTKSFVSTLTGIAFDQGIIESLSKNTLDYFPKYNEEQMDSRKKKITLEHLLTCTAGFAYDENKEMTEWFLGGKLSAEYDALNRAMQSEPGERFNYDSPSVDLLSVILTKTTKQDTFSYAQDNLFHPLGIKDVEWEKDPADYYRGCAGMVMKPRDTAKLGQLYLQKGRWNGEQLVSEHWVEQSIIPYKQLPGSEIGYGRLWWTRKIGNENIFFGMGYGGQFLIVAPEKELIVVANHDWYVPVEQARQQGFFFAQVFTKIIENVH